MSLFLNNNNSENKKGVYNMKKLITLLLAVVILSAMVIPASAATEEEVLAEFKKLSISRYVWTEAENLAANYDATEEQLDVLLELVKNAQEAFPEDKGPGYAAPDNADEDYFGTEKYPYTEEQLDTLMGIIAEGCDTVGFTYEFINSENPKHSGDVVLVIYDTEGKIAFMYDGDVIKKLGEIDKEGSAVPYLVGGISLIVLAGVAVAAVKFKKKEQA